MTSSLAPILAGEDEDSDAYLLRYAFQRAQIPNPLVIVPDGFAVTEYLLTEASHADRAAHPLPVAILLDLKMPRMSGFDVLEWLAERSTFAAIPAYVLSSSAADEDVARALKLGAQEYFVKPHSLQDFVTMIRRIPLGSAVRDQA